jgi:hypothetical protein
MILPLCFNSFVVMAIFSLSLFFLDLHVSNFFLFFSLGPSCVHFFYNHVSFVILTWREREISTHSVELYFVEEIDGTRLALN